MLICRVDKATAQAAQVGHGGWSPEMARELGNKGVISRVDGDGDVHVSYVDGGEHCWNPILVERRGGAGGRGSDNSSSVRSSPSCLPHCVCL